jgi:hypothetical protein
MKTFELDDETKELIEYTSNLMGVDKSIIKEVYQYMLFTWFLKLSQSDKKVTSVQVPYLGKIGLRYGQETLSKDSDSIEPQVDAYVILNEEFKKMLYDIHNNKNSEIAEFIQQKHIDHLIDSVTEK